MQAVSIKSGSILSVVLTLLMSACAGAPLSPGELAFRRTAKTSTAWDDGITGTLRYNPARCECPEFEFLTDAVWRRVEIANDIGKDPLMIELYRQALAAGPGWTAEISGVSRGVEKVRYRFPVVRLEIGTICPDGVCPAAPVDDTGPTDAKFVK